MDNMSELDQYEQFLKTRRKVKIGLRIASEEEPNFDFYTSRLGIRYDEIKDYYIKNLKIAQYKVIFCLI